MNHIFESVTPPPPGNLPRLRAALSHKGRSNGTSRPYWLRGGRARRARPRGPDARRLSHGYQKLSENGSGGTWVALSRYQQNRHFLTYSLWAFPSYHASYHNFRDTRFRSGRKIESLQCLARSVETSPNVGERTFRCSALSRLKQGFDSPRERQRFQALGGFRGLLAQRFSNFSPTHKSALKNARRVACGSTFAELPPPPASSKRPG